MSSEDTGIESGGGHIHRLVEMAERIGMCEDDALLFADLMTRYKRLRVPFINAVNSSLMLIARKEGIHVYISDPNIFEKKDENYLTFDR